MFSDVSNHFYLVFPPGCQRYEGPHSIVCLTQNWYSAGCLEEGLQFPEILNPEELMQFDNMNLM